MEKIIDLIATDSAASEISDHIKQALFSKASERIDSAKSSVALSMFGIGETETEGDE
jgi:hypothetical protein